MQGEIISFDEQSKQGMVIANDGTRYPFSAEHWQGQYLPKVGDIVEFAVSATNEVTHVSYSEHSHQYSHDQKISNTSSIPPVPSVNPNPEQYSEGLYSEEANYNMINWFMKCLRNYATFKGRARRKEYWYFYLVYVILAIVAASIDFIIFKMTGEDLEIVANILSLVLFIPTLAVGARRLHDIGKSGWWQLVGIVPVVIWMFIIVWSPTMATIITGGIITLIAWIILIVWLATETKPETNRYGPPAKPM